MNNAYGDYNFIIIIVITTGVFVNGGDRGFIKCCVRYSVLSREKLLPRAVAIKSSTNLRGQPEQRSL